MNILLSANKKDKELLRYSVLLIAIYVSGKFRTDGRDDMRDTPIIMAGKKLSLGVNSNIKHIRRKSDSHLKSRKQQYIYTALVLIGIVLIGAASLVLLTAQREYSNARDEYGQLRELYLAERPIPIGSAPIEEYSSFGNKPSIPADNHTASPMTGLLELNSDFVGWITIEGTMINYPITRGSDNEIYLTTTFCGQINPSGSIFMDYRCGQGFDGPICILYGHNMKDGSMFTSLHEYLDPAFMKAYPDITVTTLDARDLTYRVFDARHTTVKDMIYSLTFPEEEERLLILSTCIAGGNKDARLLIYSRLLTKP